VKLSAHIADYTERAVIALTSSNLSRRDITTGREAWQIAHRAGIVRHAYDIDRSITDAHVQTALEAIFPYAVFKDKKRY
tara:strand:- start:610 stop:846 length:237 start_codon:yes stop_codon:yes gene_type:complete